MGGRAPAATQVVPFRWSRLKSAPKGLLSLVRDVISGSRCLASGLFPTEPELWASLFRVCFQLASGAEFLSHGLEYHLSQNDLEA